MRQRANHREGLCFARTRWQFTSAMVRGGRGGGRAQRRVFAEEVGGRRKHRDMLLKAAAMLKRINESFEVDLTRQRRAREPLPCADGSSEATDSDGGGLAPAAALVANIIKTIYGIWSNVIMLGNHGYRCVECDGLCVVGDYEGERLCLRITRLDVAFLQRGGKRRRQSAISHHSRKKHSKSDCGIATALVI